MCPYSDLEFAFLIKKENDKVLSYFRFLAELLELRTINLGETKFPIFGNEFESPTIAGFCMDTGGNTPLGTKDWYVLIHTPCEMAQFLDHRWINDNVILANAMSSVCYVIGNSKLFTEYQDEKQKILDQNRQANRHSLSMQLLKGHINEFAPDLSNAKEKLRAVGVKKELYRPFQAILGSLSLYYSLEVTSTFEILKHLFEMDLLSEEGCANLQDALNQVLEFRFLTHLSYQNEKEIMLHGIGQESKETNSFYLDKEQTQSLERIYATLIEFHKAAQEFINTRDRSAFKNSHFGFEEPFYDQALERITSGDRENAEAFLQTALALNPNNIEAKLEKVNVSSPSMWKYRYDRNAALDAVHISIKLYGLDHFFTLKAYYLLGEAYAERVKLLESIEAFKKMITISKSQFLNKSADKLEVKRIIVGGYMTLANIYRGVWSTHSSDGIDYAKAAETYASFLAIDNNSTDPYSSNVYSYLADVQEKLGLKEEAMRNRQQAFILSQRQEYFL